jgi:predicted RNA-binding Zn ribbon-like protein
MIKKSLFRFVTDRLALDFLTTLGGRGDMRNIEKLVDPSALLQWLVEANIVEAGDYEISQADVEAAIALRETIHQAISVWISMGVVSEVQAAILNEYAKAEVPVPELIAGQQPTMRRTVQGHQVAVAGLALVARDAIALLCSQQAGRVRACANPACQALFIDLSRPGMRRWCSMDQKGCGNRAKTGALRNRRRGN